MRLNPRFAALAAVGLAAAASAGPTGFSEWNLIVANNLYHSTSEVDGSTLIGGSLLGGTSNYGVQGITAADGTGLAVGGQIANGVIVQINNGGNLRMNNLGNQNGTVNLNGGGGQVQDGTVASRANNLVNQARNASNYLAGLAATGTLDGAGNMNSVANYTFDGEQVAVYNITQAQYDSGLGQLNLNFGAADTVIINFSTGGTGVADLSAPPNQVGGFNQANSSRILWNFFDTTDLTINGAFNGAVFAADAELSLNGGGINGTVVVDSIKQQDAEIRRFGYTGYVPTPGTLLLMAGGGLVATRRRRA